MPINATDPQVLISSTESIPGYENSKYIGLVWASSARTLDSISELGAMLKSVTGGELPAFKKMLNEARHAVLIELGEHAKARGANAIVAVRLENAAIVSGTLEVYAYGTAVIAEKSGKKK